VFAIVFGALAITAEYTTGLIRLTFLAVPRRGRVLAAKAIIVSSAVLLASILANVIAWISTVPRNSSSAITFLTSLVLLPLATGWMITGAVRQAVLSVLPTAGLEIQRSVDDPAALALGPGGGLAMTAAWAVVSLQAAWWSISRRDV
jgi:ABC-2 type transport system permease protein